MARAHGLAYQRVTLIAGVVTPIYPPHTAKSAIVGNATGQDIELHSDDEDLTQYLVIPAGYERPIPVERYLFMREQIAFWLRATVSGPVVLQWY